MISPSYLVGIDLFVNVVSVAVFLTCWFKSNAASKKESEAQASLIAANFRVGDEAVQYVLDLVQKLSESLTMINSNQVAMARNQCMEIEEHRALQKQFSDMAFAVRILNAQAKRTLAEEQARGNSADALKARREEMRKAAEALDASRGVVDVVARNKISGLIPPGTLPSRLNLNCEKGNL